MNIKGKMSKYLCNRCGFRFESKNPIDCGYCGRSDSVELEKNAGELLDEVDKLLKD